MKLAHYTDLKTGQRYIYDANVVSIKDLIMANSSSTEAFKFHGIVFVHRGGHYMCMSMAKKYFGHNDRQRDNLGDLFEVQNSYKHYSGFVVRYGKFVSRKEIKEQRRIEKEAQLRKKMAEQAAARAMYPTTLASGQRVNHKFWEPAYDFMRLRAVMIKDVVYTHSGFHLGAITHAADVLSKGNKARGSRILAQVIKGKIAATNGYVDEGIWKARQ